MKKIRVGRVPTYIGTIDPVVDAVRDTYRSIETHNPNETAINRGIAYYTAAIEAMRRHKPDEAGRYWEPIEVDPSTLDDAPPMEVQGEDDAPIAASSARSVTDAAGAGGHNPVYHDPPLREKTKEGESFEDLVRQFSEAPSQVGAAGAAEHEPNDYEPSWKATPDPAPHDMARKGAATPVEQASDLMAGTAASEDDLDAFLRSKIQAGQSEGVDAGVPEADAWSTASAEEPAERVQSAEEAVLSVMGEPAMPTDVAVPSGNARDSTGTMVERVAHETQGVEGREVVIGFTERTADTLVKIEEALGSKNPVDSMKTTEAEISAQLKWTKPVDEMSMSDLDDMFSSMEETISRSANRAR
jgi:intracellular multiplication protein IcmO